MIAALSTEIKISGLRQHEADMWGALYQTSSHSSEKRFLKQVLIAIRSRDNSISSASHPRHFQKKPHAKYITLGPRVGQMLLPALFRTEGGVENRMRTR